ncbi:hypothetical protein BIFADO_01287 [Bifidobacterium adolescentis L2-32]|uniref:Uncharacterized protein n=1 Tax=Bifidobacterium adolescentis L2-32 TaxID=411481 RepID=A7A610_BIFAD|nr:hypothetical protein BIFADO_01287 [Bifidobacterium adolescentis L2-32]
MTGHQGNGRRMPDTARDSKDERLRPRCCRVRYTWALYLFIRFL